MLPKFRGVSILRRISPCIHDATYRFPKENRVKINEVITDHISILVSWNGNMLAF